VVSGTIRVAVVAVVVAIVTVAPVAAVAGATGATGSASAATAGASEATDGPGATDAHAATGQSDGGQAAEESTCAAEPPDDHADPDGDPLGWEDGAWYDESIAVDQSDGLNDTELNVSLARTKARVEYVRCLEFEEDVPVEVISRDEFRDRQLNRSVSPALRTFDNAKFEALFLIGEDQDSIAVQNANRATAVLGYYDPRNDTIVLVSENRSMLRIDEVTLAHELVHALQDARWNLTDEPFGEKLRDQANANDGLVEGDASFVDYLYGQRCDGAWSETCLEQERGTAGELANIGVYFLKFQPYSDGPAFVRLAHEFGGWEAVNAIYDDPPESTEQVIHVRRYGQDEPTNVTLDDEAGEEWTRVRPPDRPDYASVGESGIASMFVYPLYHSEGQTQLVPPSEWLNTNRTGGVQEFDPLHYDVNYSEGWDGDRIHVYRNDADEIAYVWRIAWDSPQDAQEFVAGYGRLLRYWGGEQVEPGTWVVEDGAFEDAFRVSVEGTTVTIVNAPTREDLETVRPDSGGGNATLNVSAGGNASGNATAAGDG